MISRRIWLMLVVWMVPTCPSWATDTQKPQIVFYDEPKAPVQVDSAKFDVVTAPSVVRGQLPSKSKRDALFTRSGISEAVAPMDELDRDLLYGRAKSRGLDELIRLYPKMSPTGLKQLKEAIAETQR